MYKFFSLLILLGALLGAALKTSATAPLAQVSGTVRDSHTHKALPGVSITLAGTSTATVSNADGTFVLKFPASTVSPILKVQTMGYAPATMAVNPGDGNLVVKLQPVAVQLKALTVRPGEGRDLVAEALRRVPDNYPGVAQRLEAFYRETVQKRSRLMSVSEAVIDLAKMPYKRRSASGERVRVVKGRRVLSPKDADTIAVKIVGGPTIPINLDVAKNPEFLFTDTDELSLYDFTIQNPEMLDGRMQYVVAFRPTGTAEYVLFRGRLYLDQETLAFTRIEMEADMSNRDKVTRAMLVHRPRGLRFKPLELSYTVSYKMIGADDEGLPLWGLNYISAASRFKCDWHRRLFSSPYTTQAEMVVIDSRDPETVAPITRREAFGQRDQLVASPRAFDDPSFWADYNIIEPTESLEKALPRLLRSARRR